MVTKAKKQLNVQIDAELKSRIRYLASQYCTPLYPIAEHLLQVGLHYLEDVASDTQKKEILTRHIIDTHLLGIGPDDDLAVLTIGEAGDCWRIFEYSKPVLRAYKKYCQVVKLVMRTGDVRYIEKVEKDLIKAAGRFAIHLQKWAMGVQGNNVDEQGLAKQEPNEGKG